MKYTLRPYQAEAVKKLLWSRRLEGADLCVLPTGAGKSIIIAELARQMNQPILILQPTKEILEQNLEKLEAVVGKDQIGVYSASMNRKDINTYTFATIGSIYRKPELFKAFRMVLIDECHLVNPKRLGSMYTSFLTAIGEPKVVGFTATPYRLDQRYERLESGTILTHTCTKLINRLKERFWHRIMFNINNADLIEEGYLVPLKYIDKSIIEHDEIPTNISKSDFDLGAYDEIMLEKLDNSILESIYFGMELSKSVLVFCSSVYQATSLCELTTNSAVVTAKTKKKERARIIKDFRSGKIQTVFNVGVLTIGFDHPSLSCIVLLRPTKSIGLYYQMLGRGVRKAEGKDFCYVIDMTGTVNFIGKVETIKLVKRDMWELESEKGSWHKRPLYSFMIKER
jgi:DNA repair protein RadD